MLRLNNGSEEQDIEDTLGVISDSNFRSLFRDLIACLRKNNLEAAQERLRLQSGEAGPALDLELSTKFAIQSNANSDCLISVDELSSDDLDRLFNPKRFHEWILFLHPDQKKIVEADYDRPFIFTGVSGSGKTCVLVHRAQRLAKKHPGEQIGILTLNRRLSQLIRRLVDQLCGTDETTRSKIEVMAVYDYFKRLYLQLGCADEYLKQLQVEADNAGRGDSMREVCKRRATRTVGEKKDHSISNSDSSSIGICDSTKWEEFCNKPDVRTEINRLQPYLNKHNITNVTEYVREELELVWSAFLMKNRRDEYLKMKRAGRAVPFLRKHRERILRLLIRFDEEVFSLTQSLLPLREKICELPDKFRYRCLLVDEFQDLSTLNLSLLRRVPMKVENGLFLTGDPVQRITVRPMELASAGLDGKSVNRMHITKNYRNGRQILSSSGFFAGERICKASKQTWDEH